VRAEFVGGQIFCCVGALAIGVCDWCVCLCVYGCSVRVRVYVCECVPSLMVAKSFAVLVPWLLVCVIGVCVWMYGCVRVCVCVCECVPGLMVAKSFAVLVPWLFVCVFCVCVYGCMCMCVCVCVYVSACGV